MDAIGGIRPTSINLSGKVSAGEVMREANQAISKWDLQHLGWRGFQQLDWVEDITNKYPEAVNIAHAGQLQPGAVGHLQRVRALDFGLVVGLAHERASFPAPHT